MIFKQSARVAPFFFQNENNVFHRKKILQPRSSHRLFLHSEAVGPIRRDISGHFSKLTPFVYEARVKGQIQHLEKIPWP